MRNVRWGWVVLGAFVAEVVGFALLMCIRVLHGYGPSHLLAHAAKIAGGAAGGWLAARRRPASALLRAA